MTPPEHTNLIRLQGAWGDRTRRFASGEWETADELEYAAWEATAHRSVAIIAWVMVSSVLAVMIFGYLILEALP